MHFIYPGRRDGPRTAAAESRRIFARALLFPRECYRRQIIPSTPLITPAKTGTRKIPAPRVSRFRRNLVHALRPQAQKGSRAGAFPSGRGGLPADARLICRRMRASFFVPMRAGPMQPARGAAAQPRRRYSRPAYAMAPPEHAPRNLPRSHRETRSACRS